MRNFHRSLIVIFAMLVFNSVLYAGWGGLKYDKYAVNISNQFDEIFIKYGICTDKLRDCRNPNLFFISQAEPEINISILPVKNYKLIKELVDVVIIEFEHAQENGDKDLTIDLSILKGTRKKGFFSNLFNDSEFIELKLKGK